MPKRIVVRCRFFLCPVACLALMPTCRISAQTWREVDSPHFRVVTDGSDKDGRDVAKEFEQMRAVFLTSFKNPVLETAAPLLIIAVRESGLHALAKPFWKDRDRIAGEFFRGWERQYALVRLDSFGDLNQAVVFHEYTHSIYHANFHWMPTWLDEGLAEFYGYTEFRNGHIYIGAPSIRLAHLRSGSLIPIPQMLNPTPKTLGKDVESNDLFYGEAWAMVHYMTFGANMGNGTMLNKFIVLLESGKPQAEAFQEVFGDPKAFADKVYQYISGMTIKAALLPAGDAINEKSFPAKVLTVAEADYALGSIDIGAHAFEEGKARMEAAASANPALAGPHEELGFLAWREGNDDEAKTEWARAFAADPSCYRSEFALLMTGTPLKEQNAQQLEQTRQTLEGIRAKEPKFAPAVVELALIQWRLGQLNDAYKSALVAEKLEPWRAEYHLLTARILLQGKQPKVAEAYARSVAARWPGSDHDEAVDVWNRLPASARGDGPALTLSFPADATVVRGTIVSSSCEKPGLNVVMRPDDSKAADVKVVATGPFESGFADTLWMGEDHYTPCFHLAGLPGVVAYRAGGDGVNKLVVLEVRDNLPDTIPSTTSSVATATSSPAASPAAAIKAGAATAPPTQP